MVQYAARNAVITSSDIADCIKESHGRRTVMDEGLVNGQTPITNLLE